ncbi:MAG: hypothetical protein FOGNACKC_00774 [Anaerolineae bacterium]|nr:hypothetical protein [Anaerolineae bacterium]
MTENSSKSETLPFLVKSLVLLIDLLATWPLIGLGYFGRAVVKVGAWIDCQAVGAAIDVQLKTNRWRK